MSKDASHVAPPPPDHDGQQDPQWKKDNCVTLTVEHVEEEGLCWGEIIKDLSVQEVHSTSQDDRHLKTKPAKDKMCLVCGDKALGYNFNAVSCESCKAFFRRNAFKEIRGRCEGDCDVTVESRSYCKKCRLKKCFTVGMKRDLILNETQKHQRRVKIHENRLRRQGVPLSPLELASGATSLPADSGELTPDNLSSPGPSTTLTAQSPEQHPEVTHQIAAVVEPNALDSLSESHKELIQEVMSAFEISFDGPMERQPVDMPSNVDFLNMADTSVRRLVKMAKHLSLFQLVSQEDQISLLKGAVVEVLILRSAKMFDTSTGAWSVNKNGQKHTVSAASLQFGSQESNSFFEQYHRFATTLLHSTKGDNVVLMLMIVMTVFSPDRSSSKNIEHVTKTQEEYAKILEEYIRHRYRSDELMFPRVLQKLADIRDLNETHTRMLTHMRVEELEPLIVEIFDVSA